MVGRWKIFKDWLDCSFGKHAMTKDDFLRVDGASEDKLPIITECSICKQKIAVRPHPSASWMYRIEEI